MSQLTLEPPMAEPRPDVCGARSRGADPGGEPSLDSMLSGMWEGLAARLSVDCPLCGGEVVPLYGVHARPVGGRCQSCATELT